MNDFVRAMHTRSGLINEWEHGLSLDEAQAKVIEYVRKFTPAGVKPLLAGNTIGSDKKFLTTTCRNSWRTCTTAPST